MKLKGSWRTTLIGWLTALGLLIPQLINLLDNDPATTFSWKVLVAALAAAGFGTVTRDNRVSSEKAGAK